MEGQRRSVYVTLPVALSVGALPHTTPVALPRISPRCV
jgi:hypothetical protein